MQQVIKSRPWICELWIIGKKGKRNIKCEEEKSC